MLTEQDILLTGGYHVSGGWYCLQTLDSKYKLCGMLKVNRELKYKMATKKYPTQDVLHKTFTYDPDGFLLWDTEEVPRLRGKRAGYYCYSRGYWVIIFKKQVYYAHVMIYIFHNGHIKDVGDSYCVVDHINRNPSDNTIQNLRIATCAQNIVNSKTQSNNKLGLKGVFFDAQCKKFRVQIKNPITKKRECLGDFKNKYEAYHTYITKHKEYYLEFSPSIELSEENRIGYSEWLTENT